MKTTVVNKFAEPFDVYIGRGSPWGNPFAMGHPLNRNMVIDMFREYFFNKPDLMARARKELKGKVLGCFCKPKACHGDVIAEYLNRKTLDQ